jgi:TRAP-type C4-dicarboxylate transport system permease small subunit
MMFNRLIRALNFIAIVFGGLAILSITLLGGADIILTYLRGRPIPAVYEATQMLMVIAVFSGLGVVHLNRSHISVDIGYDLMPTLGKRLSDALTLILMIIFFGALGWRGWSNALHSWKIGEYAPGIIAFPIYPAKFALAIGCTLALVCCLADLARGARFRKDAPVTPPPE